MRSGFKNIVNRSADSRGGIVAEFALTLPILILLVQGVISFGLGFREYAVVVDAVRASARGAAANRTTTSPCTISDQIFSRSLQQYGVTPSDYTLSHGKYRFDITATGTKEWFYLLNVRRNTTPLMGFLFDWVFSSQVESVFMFEAESQGNDACLTEVSSL